MPWDDTVADGDQAPHTWANNLISAVKKRGAKYVVTTDSYGDYECDGTNDDVQIQAAVDALTAGRDYVEKVALQGAFSIGATIDVPSYTALDMYAAKLTMANNVNDDMFNNADPTGGDTSIFFLGGYLLGNYANQTAGCGIELNNADRCHIYDSWILQFKQEGVWLHTGAGVGWIQNCRISQNRSNGVNLGGSDNFIMGCDIGTNQYSGIILGSGGGYNHVHNNQVFENVYDGIRLTNQVRCTISDNWCDLNNRNGIYILATTQDVEFNSFTGNIIRANGQGAVAAADDGIQLADDGAADNCQHNTIVGNIIHDDGATQDIGINELNGSDYNIIKGNVIHGNTGSGVYCVSSNPKVYNNTITWFFKRFQ